MKDAAQKIKATTQKFTEIEDIIENIVLLSNNDACLVIETTATNFPLLSPDEQYAKLYSYASLLNSLSFPIQILIRNKTIDISSYIKLLSIEIEKTKNPVFLEKIKLYKEFVESIVKINSVLDKNFYIIIPYSHFEEGTIGGVTGSTQKQEGFNFAKTALKLKEDSLLPQLAKLGLHAKTLSKDKLIALFYSIYNNGHSELGQDALSAETPIVRGKI